MGLIGGDSQLSPRGQAYSQRLGALMKQLHPEGSELVVWTSSLKRTQLTAASIGRPIVAWKALDEIDAGGLLAFATAARCVPCEACLYLSLHSRVGICDGMTYEDIAAKMVRKDQHTVL